METHTHTYVDVYVYVTSISALAEAVNLVIKYNLFQIGAVCLWTRRI